MTIHLVDILVCVLYSFGMNIHKQRGGMDMIWEKLSTDLFIIAEAGKNFIQTEEDRSVEEYLANAKQLVDEAAAAGVDAVKWQTHNVEDEQLDIDVTAPHFKGSDRYSWVTRNTNATPFEAFWKPLKAYCDKKGIYFLSTPMSRGAAKMLDSVGMQFWKIGSGDILDFVMLDYMRESGKPIIISSGMSTLEEVKRAVAFLREKNDKVALLHCVSQYPCPPEELRLPTIELYKEIFQMPIGFSDHSLSFDSVETAVALGATIIEKHFSMDRELYGADHKVSFTPGEFKELVDRAHAAYESGSRKKAVLASDFAKRAQTAPREKCLQEGESAFRPLFRKSLMAGHDMSVGTVLTKDVLYAMRPQQYAGGLPSEEYESVLGKTITKALKKYDPITKDIIV